MTTAHHTPHSNSAPLTSAEVNRPLGELDESIASVIATGSGTATTLTAQANSGQASLTVASSAGFAPGDPIYIGTGAVFESRIVNTVPGGGVTITVTVNLTNTYAIGKPVSKSPVEIVDARAGAASLGARLATMVPVSGPGEIEINGGFVNSFDTYLWVAGANRTNPTVATQGIWVQHRVSGNLGAVVHDAMATELRISGGSNATFLNAFEATGSLIGGGGAHTIPDLRAITANLRVESTPTGTITAASIIRAQVVPAIGALVITTLYGLYVEAQTVGATNWSIYAPTGNSLFGMVKVSQAIAAAADIQLHTSESLRWIIRKNTTAEGGANAGSDLEIMARSDTGTAVGTALTITRSNIAIRFGTGPLGFFNITPVAKKTGWTPATGTPTRTTFVTSTVTLPQLAERVKALIDDLHETAGYGLIAT